MIDREFLSGFTGGDEELEAELIGFFVDNASVYMPELVDAEPGEAWRTVAHKLKGAARSVGAVVVSDLALEAEFLDSSRSNERERVIEALNRAIAEVKKALG